MNSKKPDDALKEARLKNYPRELPFMFQFF